AQLVAAGAKIQRIALGRSIPHVLEAARAIPVAFGNLSVFSEATRALACLVKHRVPISTRTFVTSAMGENSVERVSLSKLDSRGRRQGRGVEIEADLLLLGYGFCPSTELARQIGCALEYNSRKGGWVVSHDDQFETSTQH